MEEKESNVKTMDEEYAPGEVKKQKWSELIDTHVLDFFAAHKFEKLSVEDGEGNKAKLSLTKDNDVKIEISSTTIR